MKEYIDRLIIFVGSPKQKQKHFVVEVPMGRALGRRFYVQEREEYLLTLEFNWRLNLVGKTNYRL
jgi:hypothetical protein